MMKSLKLNTRTSRVDKFCSADVLCTVNQFYLHDFEYISFLELLIIFFDLVRGTKQNWKNEKMKPKF